MADDGLADETLHAALVGGSQARLLAALAGARVFAAVTAVATGEETGAHGLRQESTAEMAVLLLEAGDARALPVFTSVPALLRWSPEARPVPLSGRDACRAALDEGAQEVVVDPPYPGRVLSAGEVRTLASGYVPVAGSRLATRRVEGGLQPPVHVPDGLVDALREALRDERLRAARLLEGPDGLVVGVTPRNPLDAAALAELAQRVMTRLGVALPPEGLDLAQVPADGPGVPVVRRRWFRPGR